ncbi:MAG TPA: KOW domain-containing RNA-binding protein [Mobilitalea sp.]|nr:KOW domain-containing RNA-binding protein [Mobilitalea sp.]
MEDFVTGGFVASRAGHDLGKYYVIFSKDSEYVYLVDGRIRTLDCPKKKIKKHVIRLDQSDPVLADKIVNRTARNEEIKRAIKLLPIVNSGKEVE